MDSPRPRPPPLANEGEARTPLFILLKMKRNLLKGAANSTLLLSCLPFDSFFFVCTTRETCAQLIPPPPPPPPLAQTSIDSSDRAHTHRQKRAVESFVMQR